MVNKVRKKDGSLKPPYSVIMPFKDARNFIEQIKIIGQTRYGLGRNTYYGVRIFGSTGRNVDYKPLIEFFKSKNISEKSYSIYENYLIFDFYIAFSEFDKEV